MPADTLKVFVSNTELASIPLSSLGYRHASIPLIGVDDSVGEFRFELHSNADGTSAQVQLDNFDITLRRVGDFNGDGSVNAIDIDHLASAARNDSGNLLYDLNGDGIVTFAVGQPNAHNPSDSDVLIYEILETRYGDADLNRQVFLSDLTKLATNYRQAGQFGWADGNFNGSWEAGTAANPRVFLADLTALATHWRFGVGTGSAIGAALPEHSNSSTATNWEHWAEQMSEPLVTGYAEATAMASPMAAAGVASLQTETPVDQQDSQSHEFSKRYRHAKFDGDDLLLLALDRIRCSARHVVPADASKETNGRQTSHGELGTLTDDALDVALAI